MVRVNPRLLGMFKLIYVFRALSGLVALRHDSCFVLEILSNVMPYSLASLFAEDQSSAALKIHVPPLTADSHLHLSVTARG